VLKAIPIASARQRVTAKEQIVPGGYTAWNTLKSIKKRRPRVERIVVLNGHSEENDLLLRCLSQLFPEIEIHTQSSGIETLGFLLSAMAPEHFYEGEENHEKHPGCR
jgi:hypothetical protein